MRTTWRSAPPMSELPHTVGLRSSPWIEPRMCSREATMRARTKPSPNSGACSACATRSCRHHAAPSHTMHHALPTVKAHGSFNAMFNVANHSTTIATRDVCSATARSPATTELTTLRASGAAAVLSPLPRASAGWRSLGIRDPGADGASEKPGRDGGEGGGSAETGAPGAVIMDWDAVVGTARATSMRSVSWPAC